MKRSTCASGSGYVPSDSIGFWVASTRNGSGTMWVLWPIVTWRSCITSSSADCTLAGARLISSASRKLQKTGPRSVSKSALSGRKTRVPTRSLGTRSGVNCTRLNEPPSTDAVDLIVSVFARPGTPSISRWPPESRQHEHPLEHLLLAGDHAPDLEQRLFEPASGDRRRRDSVLVCHEGLLLGSVRSSSREPSVEPLRYHGNVHPKSSCPGRGLLPGFSRPDEPLRAGSGRRISVSLGACVSIQVRSRGAKPGLRPVGAGTTMRSKCSASPEPLQRVDRRAAALDPRVDGHAAAKRGVLDRLEQRHRRDLAAR